MIEGLHATAPAPDRADKMGLYGWLIGDWTLDVTEYAPDGAVRRYPGAWHFGWVLGGRAIQAVWIVPDGAATGTGQLNRHGTTLRVYDPGLDAWRITWVEPVQQTHLSMIGRRQGDRIVQDGVLPDGRPIRWSFSDIGPDSFLWRSEISPDQG